MSSLAELIAEAPTGDVGVDVQTEAWSPAFSPQRLLVQIAVPITDAAVATWGTGEWGTAEYSSGAGTWGLDTWGGASWSSGLEWLDITARVISAGWTRGTTSLLGRPEVGSLVLELDNDDGYFSPHNTLSAFPSRRFLAPGTLIRAGWYMPAPADVAWSPAFTGEVLELLEDPGELDAGATAIITASETTGRLADIDRQALVSAIPQMPGEARFVFLLRDADWPYGFFVGAFFTPATIAGHSDVQATFMAGNRLGECYLTADSVGSDFVTARAGYATLAAKDPAVNTFSAGMPAGFSLGETYVNDPSTSTIRLPWAEAPKVKTNTEDLVNYWTIARVGGSAVVAGDDASRAVNGTRTSRRTDLIHADEAWSLGLAQYLASVTGAPIRARKLEGVELDADLAAEVLPVAIRGLDINGPMTLHRTWPRDTAGEQGDVTWHCAIRGYSVSVVALGSEGGTKITASLSFVVLEEE